MSDNLLVPISGGTATLATDDVGGVHHQRVKVSQGADGSASDVSETNPLPTRPMVRRISVAAAGLDNAAYAGGETMGDLMTVAGAARASGGGGFIVGVMLIDAADAIGAVDVLYFDSSVTLGTDNATYSISDADALKAVANIPLAGPYDLGGVRIAQAFNLSIPFVCNGSADLFASMISRGTTAAFPNANDITLVTFIQN